MDITANVTQLRETVDVQLDICIFPQPVLQPMDHCHELAVLRVPIAQCFGNTLRVIRSRNWPLAQLLRPRQVFQTCHRRIPGVQHFDTAEMGAEVLAACLYLLLGDVGGLPLAMLHGWCFQLDTESAGGFWAAMRDICGPAGVLF